METSQFLPKTDFRQFALPELPSAKLLSIDIGYSSVKTGGGIGFACVPSYCRKMNGEFSGKLDKNGIVYECDGTFYQVGDLALSIIKRGEAIDEGSFYDRDHYLRDEFLIQFRVGVALALWDYHFDKPIKLTTGLPPAYVKEDSEYVKRALKGLHSYTIHFGEKSRKFNYMIDAGDIDIISQPMGTFYSIGMNDKGEMTANMKKYWNSNIMIFDGGFGTLDIYAMRGNEVVRSTTADNLGMKRVLQEVQSALFKDRGKQVTIPELMSALNTGMIQDINKVTFVCENIDISDYLKRANKIIAGEAFDYVKNDIVTMNNFVMTGGTGAAWYHIFEEKLHSLIENGVLTLIPGNIMCTSLPYYYSNVRGYYMYRYFKELHQQ